VPALRANREAAEAATKAAEAQALAAEAWAEVEGIAQMGG